MGDMNTIDVRVRDHSGNHEALVPLRTRRTIGQVRPTIIESLALSEEEPSGEPITYAMYNDSVQRKPYLQDSERVGEVLSEGQTLRVVPEIISGRRS